MQNFLARHAMWILLGVFACAALAPFVLGALVVAEPM